MKKTNFFFAGAERGLKKLFSLYFSTVVGVDRRFLDLSFFLSLD